MSAPYRIELRSGPTPGTVVGTAVDAWGWTIEITATRDPDGVYRGTGVLGPVPEALQIPGLDDGA